MSHDKQTILITGASGHLGQNFVAHYLSRGFHVIGVLHRSTLPPYENLTCIVQDMSLPNSGSAIIQKALAVSDRIDFIINNAARQGVALLKDESVPSIAETVQVNLSSVVEIYSEIARQNSGAHASGVQAIVNITSIEARNARLGHGVYGASKAGLEAMTKSVAHELAPIRSNALRLGLIEKEGIRQGWPTGVAAWEENAPLGRMGTVTDVLMATDFLLAATWMSGSVVTLDGGMSAKASW